jgi:flagellar biosynthesis/type III secretory pathway M-ring protein FliF/YscJ
VGMGGVGSFFHRCARYHYQVMNELWNGIVWSLAPTILVGLLFWVIMRAIVRADRTERKAYARMEAEERARRGLPQKP